MAEGQRPDGRDGRDGREQKANFPDVSRPERGFPDRGGGYRKRVASGTMPRRRSGTTRTLAPV